MTRNPRSRKIPDRTPRRGLLITFEGIEGVGKTVQLRRLIRRLDRAGLPVLATREPGGSPIAERIRRVILRRDHDTLVASSELFLYLAARAQHVADVIRPALAQGKIVVCDRFSDATFAYQGDGRGISKKLIGLANGLATGGLDPDLTVLLDLDVRRALARVRRRGMKNRLDAETVAFFQKVREGYLRRAKADPGRVQIIRSGGTIASVGETIWSAVTDRLTTEGFRTMKRAR